jgi:hypothetical protein
MQVLTCQKTFPTAGFVQLLQIHTTHTVHSTEQSMRKECNITFLPLATPPLILDAKFLTARRILCAQTL